MSDTNHKIFPNRLMGPSASLDPRTAGIRGLQREVTETEGAVLARAGPAIIPRAARLASRPRAFAALTAICRHEPPLAQPTPARASQGNEQPGMAARGIRRVSATRLPGRLKV